MPIKLMIARLAAVLTGASMLCAVAIGPASAATITLAGPAVLDVDTDPATIATVTAVTSAIIADINISVLIIGGIPEFFEPAHMEDWTLEIEHLGTTVLLRAGFGFPPHLDSPFDITFDDEAASLIGLIASVIMAALVRQLLRHPEVHENAEER